MTTYQYYGPNSEDIKIISERLNCQVIYDEIKDEYVMLDFSNELLRSRAFAIFNDKSIKQTVKVSIAHSLLVFFHPDKCCKNNHSYMVDVFNIIKENEFILDGLIFYCHYCSSYHNLLPILNALKDDVSDTDENKVHITGDTSSNELYYNLESSIYDAMIDSLDTIKSMQFGDEVYGVVLHLNNKLSFIDLAYNSKKLLKNDIRMNPEYHPEFLKMEYPSWIYHRIDDKSMFNLRMKYCYSNYINVSHLNQRQLFLNTVLSAMKKVRHNFNFTSRAFCPDLFFSIAIYNPSCKEDFDFMEKAAKELGNSEQWVKQWMKSRRYELPRYLT